jgi:hypothetical protein
MARILSFLPVAQFFEVSSQKLLHLLRHDDLHRDVDVPLTLVPEPLKEVAAQFELHGVTRTAVDVARDASQEVVAQLTANNVAVVYLVDLRTM